MSISMFKQNQYFKCYLKCQKNVSPQYDYYLTCMNFYLWLWKLLTNFKKFIKKGTLANRKINILQSVNQKMKLSQSVQK